MTKRIEGQQPLRDAHPTRFWVPDTPGHKNRNGVIVNKETKALLDEQIERLKIEMGIVESGTTEEGSGKLV